MPDADFIGDFMSVTSIVNGIYDSLVENKGLLQWLYIFSRLVVLSDVL